MAMLEANWDWASLSLAMTDILKFQKKQITNHKDDIVSVHMDGNGIELLWSAKDMCPRYRNAFADVWLRHHEADLREFFIDYHMEAVYKNSGWKVKLSKPLPGAQSLHVVTYLTMLFDNRKPLRKECKCVICR
jgi:hypothetical protein